MTRPIHIHHGDCREVMLRLASEGVQVDAIDKLDATKERRDRALMFTAWMRSTGVTAKQINQATISNMGGHFLTDKDQPAVATQAQFDKFKHLLPDPPPEITKLITERTVESENFKNREVVETRHDSAPRTVAVISGQGDYDITKAHTPEAQQWEGWGTALKPSVEPICLAQKPIEKKTIAKNVLAWMTGALNIDGCRNNERWPANVIHDGSENVENAFSSFGTLSSGKLEPHHKLSESENRALSGKNYARSPTRSFGGDTGSAARFFYSAKADAQDRFGATHPTVKPVNLMRWLVRLVTPPGGVVLDPFAGTGTTGQAAYTEGFGCHLIEQSDTYIKDIRDRMAWVQGKGGHSALAKIRHPETAAADPAAAGRAETGGLFVNAPDGG